MARGGTVASQQRFDSQMNPCPACHGGQDMQGEERCYGYLFEDGRGYVCTNVESEQFNDDADGWLHFFDEDADEITVRVHRNGGAPDPGTPITLKELSKEKRIPLKILRALACRDVAGGVEMGGKIRKRDPKYVWANGRTPSTDPTFPMPGETIEETAYFTTGETDMLTARAAGLPAYGLTSGEKRGKPALTPAHFRDLARRGLEHAVIVGDGDDHGVAAVKHMAQAAQAAGLRVSIVDLAPLYDHFGAGVKDLNELWQSLDCQVDAFLTSVATQTRPYAEVRIYALDDLRALAETDVPFLVNEFLSPGEKMGLTGPPKNYKSWLALNLARAVATGGKFLERAEWIASTPRPVIFVEEEGDLVKFSQRVERAFRGVEDAPFHLIPKTGFSLLQRAQVDWLIERVHERDAGLLILDPWQRMIVGVDEDKAKETGPAWDEVHRITVECPECAIVILHHANKAGGLTLNAIRGSSRFAGEVDLSMIVRVESPGRIEAAIEGRDVPNHMAEEGHLEVVFDPSDPFAMTAKGFSVNVRASGRPSKEQAVLSLFEENRGVEFSKSQVADRTHMSASTAGTHIDALVSRGVLERSGRKFRLGEGGRS
jgi:AAA domain